MKKTSIFIIFLFSYASAYAREQERQIDSLKKVIKLAKHDSIIINAWRVWDDLIYMSDPQMDLTLNQKIESSATHNLKKKLTKKEKLFFINAKLFANNNLGIIFTSEKDYPRAIKHHQTTIRLAKQLQNKKREADAYNNLGVVYFNQGKYPEALEQHFAALKIRETLGDNKGIGASYTNIGNIYENQNKFPQALKCHFAALKIWKKIDDKSGMAYSYNNIGLVYASQAKYPEALEQHFAALKIREMLGDKTNIAGSYNNIGIVFYNQGKFADALKMHFTSLKIKDENGLKSGLASSYNNIGNVYNALNQPAQGKTWLQKGLNLSLKSGDKESIKISYTCLAQADSALGNYKGSVENYKLYIIYRDSLINDANEKRSLQTSMNYEFEKIQTQLKYEQERKNEVTGEEKKQQRIVIILVSCALFTVLIFAVFILRSIRKVRKQKLIIESQKHIVEEKQKEIIDSIHYAKRIQLALMPTEKSIKVKLNSLRKN